MAGALVGIRVLDLGRFVACPFCGMLLADMGAEVIRVERPGGGEDRYVGLITPSGDGYLFVNRNRNKKAISLNFERNEKAREILYELIKHSDVVIENFSPEAVKAMGITYDDLKKIKSDIVYAHISAFGPSGPYSHRLGFDPIAQAMSGAMAITGFPGPPLRTQIPWVDYSTACLATVGVVTALFHRERTGEGQMIDTSLLQTAVAYMAPYISEWETGKTLRGQLGNRGYWTGPGDLYQTKDKKWVILAIPTNSLWRRFCRSISREDLATDPRFQSDMARWEYREIIDPVVSEWVASQNAEELMAAAEQIPLPCGVYHELTEVADHPQVKAREMLSRVSSYNDGGEILVTGIPVRMSVTTPKIVRSFPAIGEHNEEIYGGILGYSQEYQARLRTEGVI